MTHRFVISASLGAFCFCLLVHAQTQLPLVIAYGPVIQLPNGARPTDVALADFDHGGRLETAVMQRGHDALAIFRQQPTGSTANRATRPEAGYFRYLTVEHRGGYDRPIYPMMFSTFTNNSDLSKEIFPFPSSSVSITRHSILILSNEEFSELEQAFRAWDAALPVDSTTLKNLFDSSHGTFQVILQDSSRKPLIRTYRIENSRKLLDFLAFRIAALKPKEFRREEWELVKSLIEVDSGLIK